MKKIKREVIVNYTKGKCRIGILEDDELAEIYIEKKKKKSIVGNIYKGRITNVLPGMSAAFVDIGVGKNALLYLQDLVLMEDGSHVKPQRISKALKANDPIIVQVTKDPMQGKGARLTTYLSIPGRLMVYMPYSSRSGVSRRLPERERDRLRKIAKDVKPETGGTIIRTAALRAKKKELVSDLEYLKRQWASTGKKMDRAKPPAPIYEEPDLVVRVVRDNLTRDFWRVLVDSKREYDRVLQYLKTAAPDLKEKVELYKEERSIFKAFGIEETIRAALRPRVGLPSGGHIVIDEAEALTAIDVNTGSYTGRRSLEHTVLTTNLEAAIEIVSQLRLRDIGGIIVIDFIDMEDRNNRARVLETLEKELQKDRTKTQIVTLSRLGLVEMTRKNVTEGLAGTLGETCQKCEGRGLIFRD